MTTVFFSPVGNSAPFYLNGVPMSGGQLFTYLFNSTTPEPTYTTVTGNIQNANPIVFNSAGYPASSGNIVEIWLTAGKVYKFVLKDSLNNTIWTRDNVSGINDIASQNPNLEWINAPVPTYISSNTFTFATDETAAGKADPGRRMKFTVTAGTVYGVIMSASVSVGVTTVIMNMTVGSLDAGLSAAFYGIESATYPSTPVFGPNAIGSSIASAATTEIWSRGGDLVHVTGVVNITSFGTAPRAGPVVTVVADGAFSITTGSNIIFSSLPVGSKILVLAGDVFTVRAETTTTHRITSYVSSNTYNNRHGTVRLEHVSSSSIVLNPVNGDGWIKIVGVPYNIGTGISSSDPSQTQNYVGGTPNQTLTASDIYDVFLFNNAGVLTFDYYLTATGTHMTDPVTGVECLSNTGTPDNSRSYVGKIFTNASKQFQQIRSGATGTTRALNGLISWYNRKEIMFLTGLSANVGISSNSGTIELANRINILTFGDEITKFTASGIFANGAVAGGVYTTGIGIDSTTTFQDGTAQASISNASETGSFFVSAHSTLSEGQHFATTLASSTVNPAGGGGYNGSSGVNRCVLKASIRG